MTASGKYCKFTIICENFIFTNIREFDPLRIQHSREMFAYVELNKKTSCIANLNFREKIPNHKIAK